MLTLLALTALLQQPQQDPQPAPTAKVQQPVKVDDDAWFDRKLADACAKAADRGLAWLAEQQMASGAWVGYVGHKQMDNYQLLDNALLPEAQRKKGE